MGCFHPLEAYPAPPGAKDRRPVFSSHQSYQGATAFKLPCGRCIGCRRDRQMEQALRAMLEVQTSSAASFVTLTYRPEDLPSNLSVSVDVHQAFMKAVRYEFGPVRFQMCAEYGDQFGRPHYHYNFFGLDFSEDRKPVGKAKSGALLYGSPRLEKCWPFGFHWIGDTTLATAAYVAGYIGKATQGDRAAEMYRREAPDGQPFWVSPQFGLSSRRPGLGAAWVQRFWDSDAKSPFLVVDGRPYPMPRYVIEQRFADDPMELAKRLQAGVRYRIEHAADLTLERQAVIEECRFLRADRVMAREFDA